MLRRLGLGLGTVLGLALAVAPAAAQDAETLRKELAELKQQLERMRQQYEQAIDRVSERLHRLEAQPAPVAAAPPAAPSVGPIAPSAPGVAQATAPRPPSALDLVRPRAPFSLAERTGRGQLLFDIGVAGDFILNFTSNRVDEADAGTFAGRENRLFPREVELSLFGQIDPFARGEVRIEAAEEFEDGERELHVGLAEAHLTLLTLPFGTQLKLGQMRNRFGLLNQVHAHDLPQPDRPLVLRRFFGEEGLVERGIELTWVPLLPFYLEGLVGVFNGDNEEAFGRGSFRAPLVTARLRTFFELGATSAIQLGVSGATGEAEDRLRRTFVGYDVKYKFTPSGWRHALLTLASEGIWARRRVEIGDPDEDELERRTRRGFGWYAYAEVQPWLRWLGGVRYDSAPFLVERGREWAVEPYITFKPSEFLRFRLGWKHTERDRAIAGLPRRADEIFLQGTFILGAHPAHPF